MSSTQEDSQVILARLAQMSSDLDGVVKGETTESPLVLTVTQTHPVITELLTVNDIPFPGIWIPDFTYLWDDAHAKNHSSRCDAVHSSGVACRSPWCGTVTKFSHLGGLAGQLGSDQDLVTTIWPGERTEEYSRPVRFGTAETETVVECIRLTDYTKLYPGESRCHQRENCHGLVCTLPTEHVYSHAAGDGDYIRKVWS